MIARLVDARGGDLSALCRVRKTSRRGPLHRRRLLRGDDDHGLSDVISMATRLSRSAPTISSTSEVLFAFEQTTPDDARCRIGNPRNCDIYSRAD
jgi:hypothetical protein